MIYKLYHFVELCVKLLHRVVHHKVGFMINRHRHQNTGESQHNINIGLFINNDHDEDPRS